MKTEYATVDVWMIIDEAGGFDVGTSEDQAQERFEENVGGGVGTGSRRVKLTVKVPLPKVIVLTGKVEFDEKASDLTAA